MPENNLAKREILAEAYIGSVVAIRSALQRGRLSQCEELLSLLEKQMSATLAELHFRDDSDVSLPT